MEKINLLEILSCKETYEEDCNSVSIEDALSAMEDVCKQVLELAAEKATPYTLPTVDKNWVVGVNKQSITNTINLVEKGC